MTKRADSAFLKTITVHCDCAVEEDAGNSLHMSEEARVSLHYVQLVAVM